MNLKENKKGVIWEGLKGGNGNGVIILNSQKRKIFEKSVVLRMSD